MDKGAYNGPMKKVANPDKGHNCQSSSMPGDNYRGNDYDKRYMKNMKSMESKLKSQKYDY